MVLGYNIGSTKNGPPVDSSAVVSSSDRGRESAMVVSTSAAAWRLTLLLCHASVLLSETQGFTPAAGAGSGDRYQTQQQRSQQSELKVTCHAHRRALLAPLEATPQHKQLDGDDVWWEGEIDPWTDAESRVRRLARQKGGHTRTKRVRGRRVRAAKHPGCT